MILETFYYTIRSCIDWLHSMFTKNQINFLFHSFMLLIFSMGVYLSEKEKRKQIIFYFIFLLIFFGLWDSLGATETSFKDTTVNEKGLNIAARIYYHRLADYNFSQAIHFTKLAQKTILIDLSWNDQNECINMFSGFLACFASSPAVKFTIFSANLAAKYAHKSSKNYFMVNYYLMAADHYLQMYNFYCDILRTE